MGGLLLVALASPSGRHLLEASMWLHMLVQYPMVILSGALLGRAVPRGLARGLSTCNVMGLTGLAASMLFMSVLMIPRVLDLALTDAYVEVAKFAALLFVGAILESSWRQAGLVVQAFFLGGFLPMTIAVGTLYQDTPSRLCNAYRLEDQQDLGRHLVYLAVAVAAVWLIRTVRGVIASEVGEVPVR